MEHRCTVAGCGGSVTFDAGSVEDERRAHARCNECEQWHWMDLDSGRIAAERSHQRNR